MMIKLTPLAINDPQIISHIEQWLIERSELFLQVYHLPKYTVQYYLISSFADLQSIEAQANHQTAFTILPDIPYPIAGLVDDELIEQAISQLDYWYNILLRAAPPYPIELPLVGACDDPDQYRQELQSCYGKYVYTGAPPSLASNVYLSPAIEKDYLLAYKA